MEQSFHDNGAEGHQGSFNNFPKPGFRMRVGILGGAFDPPHFSHVMMAVYARLVEEGAGRDSIGAFDEVWVVPSWKHGFNKQMSSFKDRLAMCNLAFGGLAGVMIRDYERQWKIQRTYDLMMKLKEVYLPKHQFSLILGADNLLVNEVGLFLVARGGVEVDHIVRSVLMPNISSTMLREAVRAGDDMFVRERMPMKVLDYIHREGLYYSAHTNERE